MAVSSRLLNGYAPYVHSNIYNFIDFVGLEFDENLKPDSEIKKTVELYKNVAKQLRAYEQELYTFCGVSNYQDLNVKLFGKNDSLDKFKDLARQVMNDPDFIRKLVPNFTTKFLENLYKILDKQLVDVIKSKLLNQNDVSYSELRRVILESLKENFISGKKTVTKEETLASLFNKNIDKNFQDNINKEINNFWKEQIARVSGKKGLLYDSETTILNNFIQTQNFSINEENFINNFTSAFIKKAEKNVFLTLPNEDIEAIGRGFGKSLYRKIFRDKNNLTNLSAILGEIGENLIKFSLKETGIEAEIIDVGKKNEIKVAQEFRKANLVENFGEAMLQYHDPRKQSQTDFLIKINKGKETKLFRVQSKNSILDQLKNKSSTKPQSIFFNDENNEVLSLLERLEKRQILSAQDTQKIAYFIANLTWFNQGGHYESRSDKTETRNRGDKGGLAGAQVLINKIMSTGIQYFIGATINEEYSNVNINVNASNIFYFLSARTIFPTSEILLQVAKALEDSGNELVYTRYKIITSSANFSEPSAKMFYEEKLRAVGKFLGREYTDSALLDVGQRQGQSIMDSVQGTYIINFNIKKILMQSSYLLDTVNTIKI